MRSVVVGLALAAALVGCSDTPKPKPTVGADQLGAPSPSMLRYLNADEREALDRVGMGGRVGIDDPATVAAGEPENASEPEGEGMLDQPTTEEQAGRLGISLLAVGVTLGAMAAPFLMF